MHAMYAHTRVMEKLTGINVMNIKKRKKKKKMDLLKQANN